MLMRRALASTVLAGCLALAACGESQTPLRASDEQVRAVQSACIDAMLRSTCLAANDKSPSTVASEGTVMIAGVGRVDTRAYRELRESGDDMCRLVKTACEGDWEGNRCRAARALWPSAAKVM